MAPGRAGGFYRTEDDVAVALADRCIHRQMPLSLGRLKGDNVECGYHGILFAPTGEALKVPSQTHVPRSCRVPSYPLVESGGFLWIWMGKRELADEAKIPAHTFLTSPDWRVVGGTLHMKARAQLLNENLLDLSHVSYLHPESIGSDDVAEADVVMEQDGFTVRVTRDMRDATAPPAFEKVMGLSGQIDRLQIAEFFAPGFHVSHLEAKPAGSNDEATTFRHKAIHAITPERSNTAHYFWALTRQYRIDDEEIDHLWRSAIPRVLEQDIAASEAIESVISAYEPSYPEEINIKVDGGPIAARRIIRRMIAEEAEVG